MSEPATMGVLRAVVGAASDLSPATKQSLLRAFDSAARFGNGDLIRKHEAAALVGMKTVRGLDHWFAGRPGVREAVRVIRGRRTVLFRKSELLMAIRVHGG